MPVLPMFPSLDACGFNTCAGCQYTDFQFYNNLGDWQWLLQFFVSHGVLSCHTVCRRCGQRVPLTTVGDRLMYRCRAYREIAHRRRQRCDYRLTALRGTFFSHSRLSLQQVAHLCNVYLSRSAPRIEYAERELGLGRATVVDWFHFCREVIQEYVASHTTMIGGPGTVVEVDEAKFGKRKYQRGRFLSGQWVLGGIQRTERGELKKCFFVLVRNRSADTLVEEICNHVRPGTTVITDCWRGYNDLNANHFRHLTVNHSLHFVDPQSGAHTQNIERSWVEVRRHVPRAGLVRHHFASYLADSYFRRMIPDHRQRRHVFWQTVATMYPPEDHTLA